MTDEELVAIRRRDVEAGLGQWAFTVSRDTIEEPIEATVSPFRALSPSPFVTVTVTAGETVVLRVEDGKGFEVSEPQFSSWGCAIDDRRQLLAEIDRLNRGPGSSPTPPDAEKS
jgi:hypothetical protein